MQKGLSSPKVAAEMRGMCDTLREDMSRLEAALKVSPADQFYRRAFVRTVWAYIEACSYGMKRLTLAIADEYSHEIPSEQRTFLLGGTRPPGLPRDHLLYDAWNGPVYNAAHTLAACAVMLGLEQIPVLRSSVIRDSEIKLMKQGASVRDRLVHPKTTKSLQVTDGELKLSRLSFQAFDRAWVSVQLAILSLKPAAH